MKECINVTFQEIAQFILDQPDNQPVDMHQALSDYPVGDFLVQYGKSRGLTDFCAGFSLLSHAPANQLDDPNFGELVLLADKHTLEFNLSVTLSPIKTFGELKLRLRAFCKANKITLV